ncbi:MAG: hydrogenase expression/formation protein HypE [Pirellulales bacterium]|nr:hydrogenase expression/formation protein HypE [Pirellulales bacterium]
MKKDEFQLRCPLPLRDHPTVQMAHGGGGRLMRDLIESLFLPAFGEEKGVDRLAERISTNDQRPTINEPHSAPHDSAVVEIGGQRLAFTTDTYTVSPLFFPGGDIGHLAVFGTVNDLAMAGAKPLWLSAGFVLEEGLPMETLARIVQSMATAAREAGVRIVTGDTKVVDKGKGDGVFINTAGIGVIPSGIEVHPRRVRPDDVVLVSGDLGRHGMAVMSVREGLEFESEIVSDCASLAGLVEALLAEGAEIHCLRDLTRGGLAAALNEIALDVAVGVDLDEQAIPVTGPVAAACEILGLDPLYVANEGRLVAFVSPASAPRALKILQEHSGAFQPAIIGGVTAEHPGTVVLKNPFGGRRILDLLSGEQLPRIC